jgi:hypothetical protein
LDLFEFFYTEGLALDRNVINPVVLKQLVAFSTDVDHGPDHFLLNEE